MKSLIIIWISVVITGAAVWFIAPPVSGGVEGPGMCAGYPDGRCESDPTGILSKDKDFTPPDPDRPYFDENGVEHAYDGTVINTPSTSVVDLGDPGIVNK